MKCQILFSGKNKKNNIILSSAENAQRVVKVKTFMIQQQHYCYCNKPQLAVTNLLQSIQKSNDLFKSKNFMPYNSSRYMY